jgi:hypothetical protein
MKPTTKTTGLMAIIIAILFISIAAQSAAASGAATFVRTDAKTQGSWQGVYGNDGYVFPPPTASKSPSYVVVNPESESSWVWAGSTADTRGLQVPSSSGRQASCWYSGGSFTLDVNINDGNTHQIALYQLDWDSKGRSETIEAVDGDTGAALNTQTVSSFVNGTYLLWDISGHVKFVVTRSSGDNAVVSGVFFDVATATTNTTSGIAHYVSTDTSTEGNWLGAYGADGYSEVGSTASVPSYAVLSPQNQLSWAWATSTTDKRALELPNNSGRSAQTWYQTPSFTIDVNVTDGGSHQIALYSVDWDSKGRAQTVNVIDAQSNALLDSRSIYGFTNGTYLVWTISGHVKFTITATSGPNAVVSGVFFGGAGTVPTAPTAPTTPTPPAPPAPPTTGGGSSSTTDPNCPTSGNAVSFLGTDTTTQGAWKGIGNFNAPPASSTLVYGKDGVILPDTEGCDQACNPFPSYVAFGPACISAATSGNTGSKANSTHAYVNLVQGSSSVMGAEPGNASNTNFFQCNYTNSNPAAPWAPMVAWRPVVDTREISEWYTCSGVTSFNLEFSFGSSTHNFEIYVVDDQNGSSNLRSEEIQVLNGDTGAVMYDSGSFTNFTGGVYYKWSVTGHVKIKVINTSTNGSNAVVDGVFFN